MLAPVSKPRNCPTRRSVAARRGCGRIVGVLAALCLSCAADARAQSQAVRFGTLWDGARVLRDAVVVIDGDTIRSVGQGDAAVPAGATVVDLRRFTGLPGLIDAHTHITYYWDRTPGTVPRGQRRVEPGERYD